MATEETRDMDDVARDLARTRSELDQTLDELGRRLAPENLRSEATTYVRDRLAEVRDRASAFTSEHAGASLGTLAALTALATLARRRRARELDAHRAVRMLLESHGADAGRVGAGALGRPRASGGRRIAMLAAVAGLAWAAVAVGRDATPGPHPRARRRPPVLA